MGNNEKNRCKAYAEGASKILTENRRNPYQKKVSRIFELIAQQVYYWIEDGKVKGWQFRQTGAEKAMFDSKHSRGKVKSCYIGEEDSPEHVEMLLKAT